MIRKALLAVCLVLALVGVSACGGNGDGDSKSSDDKSSSQKKSSSEPDLSGVPDVVAEVNGEKISKDEFAQVYKGQYQQMAMQSQQTGQAPDQDKLKKQVAENLVGTELLTQEAEKQGFTASKQKVDKTLQDLAKQNGMKSKQQFLDALEKQGMKQDQVMSDVKTQTKVDQLIAKKAGNTKPSEKELKQLYKQMTAQQEQMGQQSGKTPPFKKMRPQLVQQAESQKKSQAAQALIKNLRKDADVKVNL